MGLGLLLLRAGLRCGGLEQTAHGLRAGAVALFLPQFADALRDEEPQFAVELVFPLLGEKDARRVPREPRGVFLQFGGSCGKMLCGASRVMMWQSCVMVSMGVYPL